MTQFNLDTPIVASTKSGTQLASDLSNWRDAVHTSHKGSSQPSYRVAGMLWLDDTTSTMQILKIYDGTGWSNVGYFDTTNDLFFGATLNPRYTYPVTAGTQPTYTLTLSPALTAYVDQTVFTVEIHSTNAGGAATLNVNSLGAKAIRKISGGADVAVAANDLLAKVRYQFSYDSAANAAAGAFILVGASPDLPSLTGVITDSQLPDRLQGQTVLVTPGTGATNGFETAGGSGLYRASAGSTGNPEATYSYVHHYIKYSSSYGVDDAYAQSTSVDYHYRRFYDSGTWTSWQRCYDTSAEVQSLVDNGLAAIGYGAVASYAWLYIGSNGGYTEGATTAGSSLIPAGGVSGNATISSDGYEAGGFTRGGSAEAGTWRRHHRNNFSGTWARTGLWFRTV